MLLLSRTVHFNAAHRLARADRPDDWNVRVYGMAANRSGYGQNYDLEILVQGEPDPETGMIVNLTDLDRLLKDEVDKPLDHHHLNAEVPGFEVIAPTAENLALWIWKRVEARIEKEGWRCRLAALTLSAGPDARVELVHPDLASLPEI